MLQELRGEFSTKHGII